MEESAWQRACKDTRHAVLSTVRYQVAALIAAAVGGLIVAYVVPATATAQQQGIWGVVGVLGTVVALMLATLLWHWHHAPVRQRDEARALLLAKPKPIPLPNRGELLRAISVVQDTCGELLMAQEQLDQMQTTSPYLANTELTGIRDYAKDEYEQAISRLNAESLVAGQAFEKILSDLIGYVTTQVWVHTAKPVFVGGDPQPNRTLLGTFGKIAGRVHMTIQKIEEISGQVPDTEGSQKQ